jgi:hypothetical protein
MNFGIFGWLNRWHVCGGAFNMEIYQAAMNYNEHRNLLDSHYNGFDSEVWECHYMPDGVYQSYYFLQIHHRLEQHYGNERIVITKQRGGTRRFKSFDSVISALSQIGQTTVTVGW